MSLLLLFRSPLGTPYGSYWGPHFPRKSRGRKSYFNGHFPDQPSDDVPGSGPAGAFSLVLEQAVTVTYSWRTGLFKSYSGLERRSNHVDDPPQRYEGEALLSNAQTRSQRAALARYAAQGRPFLVGLPYEQLALSAPASGATVPVYTTAYSDWCIPGQRAIVRHRTLGDSEGVIQSVTATSITLDVAPGAVGARGAIIMPAVAVYLDATQTFARYPTAAERWQVKARNATAGFISSPVAARLALSSVTTSGNLDDLRLQARDAGAAGNSIVITQSDDALTSGGDLVEDTVAKTLHIKYMGDVTTVDQYYQLVNTGSSLVKLVGTYDGTEVVNATNDEFVSNLAGGADAAPAEVGIGATVTQFAGRPVWDRGIDVDGTASDSIQSMSEAQDLGGLPFSAGSAAVPDWGRAVKYSGRLGAELQWIKRFLDEVRGCWRTWWLATWREDLVPSAVGVGTLTVEDDGDFSAWWPLQQQYIQCKATSGALTYARISAAVPSGSNLVLSIVDEDDLPISLGAVPEMVSWLDRVRFERDSIPLKFAGIEWTIEEQARAVQEDAEEVIRRDGIKITHGTTTYLIATGTRDIVIDGETYLAQPSARGAVEIRTLGDDKPLELRLPVSHEFVQRYMAGNVPPRDIQVEIRSAYESTFDLMHVGIVVAASVEGHVARFTVPKSIDVAVRKRLPVLSVGRLCGHVLYNADCRADRAAFTVSSTIAAIDGRTVRCDIALDDTWARGGELVHTASGEAMTIFEHEQTVDLAGPHATLTLQAAIYGMQVGDAVTITAGCRHDITTCRNRFDNVPNFGGFSQLPEVNPFKPSTRGSS